MHVWYILDTDINAGVIAQIDAKISSRKSKKTKQQNGQNGDAKCVSRKSPKYKQNQTYQGYDCL